MDDAFVPHLTLVVPVFNAEHVIAGNVGRILEALERLQRPFEIVVVSDGSTDGTAELANIADDRVRVVSYDENQGKGHAIVVGIAAARGRLIGWLDGDLDIAPETIVDYTLRFDELGEHADAVIGSKRHPDSDVVYPLLRRVYSTAYQGLVWLLFRVNARDTQVGAKVFRREMLETVTPLLMVKRYAFDLEVLAVGAEFGFDRVVEAPVRIGHRFSGTSIDVGSVRAMMLDTLAIAFRIHVRHHYVRRFAAVQRERLGG